MRNDEFKTTCLTDNRMNIDGKTEHKKMKIYSIWKNDGMMTVFFLFIYHQKECKERFNLIPDNFDLFYRRMHWISQMPLTSTLGKITTSY